MKKLLLSLVLFSYLYFAQSQIKFELSLQLEGERREFIVSVPTKPAPSEGYPVVMMLHGTSGDKDVFYNAHGWKELGQEENFITVFPSSLRWCYVEDSMIKNNTKFVCGELLEKLCPSDTAELVDDVFFFRRIIELLADTLSIDQNRVFGSGFSNGCVMIFKTAMEAGDVFKAVGGVGGIYHELDSINPIVRVPIYYAVGSLDDRFIVPSYTELPFGEDSILAYLNQYIRRTLASQGLTESFQKNETALTKTYLFNECRPGEKCAPFVFSLIRNLYHQYPNGINHVVDAPRIFWNLFNNPPSVQTKNKDQSPSNVQIICQPNPSTGVMAISVENFTGPLYYKIYNSIGTVVANGTWSHSTLRLQKSNFGPGMFFLMVENDQEKLVKKILFQ
ncbi:MAG: T9SS type A sorting domain-containing protein [Saprospiraceae bacterium]|nr:T9SS type A sorting domain-containing protein [Saprospiraceae bacterium]